jgi:hypothetical protein
MTVAELRARYMSNVLDLLRLSDGRRWRECLAPFQSEWLYSVTAPNAPPNTWMSGPRGAGKTSMAAALALRDLLRAPDHARLYAAAVDQDQAR